MKKIFFTLISLLTYLNRAFAATIDPDSIIPTDTTVVTGIGDGKDVVVGVLSYTKDTVFNLIAMIAIGVFLYLGYKLIVARGNEEDFKKALLSFVYAVIGIVLVSISWALVSFVSGIQF